MKPIHGWSRMMLLIDVSDAYLNDVGGALDRLHYAHDPCLQFDRDGKFWVYLHSQRDEVDIEGDGMLSTRRWKRQKDESNINLMPEMKELLEIKRLLDDLRVIAAKLMLLVQKLLLLVLKVNAAGMKVTIAERLQLLEEFMLTEKRSKSYQRKNKD
ncbi:nuclear factor kappa-B-binding-like protein [Tanacetum coccineum]|uniref:Nuclear factor kappa-B-binding-like protein n=1 Tax=Tanacetum coccineum TaxID=301880 RepID=A0ABQ4Z2Y4_9ASTR